jgi:hypothetical protein
MSVGLAGWPLAKSAAWELGLLAACGCLFAFLALPLVADGIPVPAGVTLFFAALGGAALVLGRYAGVTAVKALGWQAAFLLSSGVLFGGVLALLGTDSIRAGDWVTVVGAYVLAWLAGLVTPGSPAGLGVRELVLLVLLGSRVPESDLVQAVVLARAVSVLGDGAFFLGALALGGSVLARENT